MNASNHDITMLGFRDPRGEHGVPRGNLIVDRSKLRFAVECSEDGG